MSGGTADFCGELRANDSELCRALSGKPTLIDVALSRGPTLMNVLCATNVLSHAQTLDA